jgi:hypothetical protein
VLICHGMAAEFGSANVTYTDPVSGFTTLQKVIDDSSDLAMFHAWETVAATDRYRRRSTGRSGGEHDLLRVHRDVQGGVIAAQNQIAWIKA